MLTHDEIRAHMVTIVCNRYFSRLWIIQEFVLARDVRFMCGNVWIHYRVLEQHVNNLGGRCRSVEWDNAFDVFCSRTPSYRRSLVKVLRHGSIRRCEDSRDQVYGLLGILDSSEHVPEVNYQKSVEQVYLDTVRIILTELQAHTVRFTLTCALRLGQKMCLPFGHMSAIRKLLEDIRMRVIDTVKSPYKWIPSRSNGPYEWMPSHPIIQAIGVDPAESPVEWWYERQGVRYRFPVQGDADQSSQNSPSS